MKLMVAIAGGILLAEAVKQVAWSLSGILSFWWKLAGRESVRRWFSRLPL